MKKGGLGERLLVLTLPPLAACVIRLLYRLLRIEFVGEEHLRARWERGERFILSFWHDQLLLMVKGYRGDRIKVLISASRDGELIARVMGCFGVGTVRGSSSRGGRQAFREMVALGKEPCDLAITPDGPKGPRHQLKEGVAQVARMTGRPVIPMAFASSRGHRFGSWDRFLLPYPFARAVYCFGEPVYYRQGEETGDFLARIETAMAMNNRQAEERLEAHGVSAV